MMGEISRKLGAPALRKALSLLDSDAPSHSPNASSWTPPFKHHE